MLSERIAKIKADMIDDLNNYIKHYGDPDCLNSKQVAVIDNVSLSESNALYYKNKVFCGCVSNLMEDRELYGRIRTISVMLAFNDMGV